MLCKTPGPGVLTAGPTALVLPSLPVPALLGCTSVFNSQITHPKHLPKRRKLTQNNSLYSQSTSTVFIAGFDLIGVCATLTSVVASHPHLSHNWPAPPASPSSLLGSHRAPSKDERRGLALVLSTLTMRTSFWDPPEDCWRREEGRAGVQAVSTLANCQIQAGPWTTRLCPLNSQEAQAPHQRVGAERRQAEPPSRAPLSMVSKVRAGCINQEGSTAPVQGSCPSIVLRDS